MNHCTILNVHPVPYLYRIHIPSEHSPVPDAAIITHCDITNYCRIFRKETIFDRVSN